MINILIVKFGALGDVVRSSYILPGLHEKYNNSNIYWLTSESAYDLLRFNPYIINLCTPNHNFKLLSGINFDVVISLDDELDILELIQDLSVKVSFGAYLSNESIQYTDNVSAWFDMGLLSRFGKEKADKLKKRNQLEHNQIFENMLSIKIDQAKFYNSNFIIQKLEKTFDNNFYNIGINSGAGGRWTSKQLNEVEVIKLINKLLTLKINGKKVRLYLLGGVNEDSKNRRIALNFSESVFYLGCSDNLLEFAARIGCLDYLITSDSLALHLAISHQVKNLSFYAPTSASEVGTFNTGVKLVSLSSDYCSYSGACDNKTITSERIFDLFLTHVENYEIS